MNVVNNDIRVMPNMLLIAGNGRNVGKTFLACKIIKKLSEETNVTAIKITPHFHSQEKGEVVIRNEDFIIFKENQINQKDSSLMLQAGAKQVFFIMARKECLREAFTALTGINNFGAIVCESGGLREFVKPGIFLFVKRDKEEIRKGDALNYSPVVVCNDGKNFDLNIDHIQYKNNKLGM